MAAKHFACKRVAPLTVVASMSNAAAAHMAMRIGALGPVHLLGRPALPGHWRLPRPPRQSRQDDIDTWLAGLNRSSCPAWCVPGALQALAQPGDDPAASCRPFDVSRSGLVLGEGAAMLVLEADEHADARAAQTLCGARWLWHQLRRAT
jgi:3-oxoacyl-[acyl-carrier-protein] synthase II